jgi:hypothetical protein
MKHDVTTIMSHDRHDIMIISTDSNSKSEELVEKKVGIIKEKQKYYAL